MANKGVVIITGASSGIGMALCKVYASNGWRVIAIARNEGRLKALQERVAQNGNFYVYVGDLKHEEHCKSVVNFAIEKFGRLDCIISNAAVSMRALFCEVDIEVLRELMEINYWASVYLFKHAQTELIKNKGSFVGVSSIGGYIGIPGRIGYSASKAALQAFLEVIRIENLKSGLHVLTVNPGFTNTEIRRNALLADGKAQGFSPRDEGKMMEADDVALKIYKAAKKRKRDLILTTEGKGAIWFRRILPSMSDKYFLNYKTREDKNEHKYNGNKEKN